MRQNPEKYKFSVLIHLIQVKKYMILNQDIGYVWKNVMLIEKQEKCA